MTKLRMCWRMPPVPWKEQKLDRQIAAFVAMDAEEREIITDKESGKSLDRPGYQALKKVILRKGDTLVVKSLNRLSRNKTDIRNELQFFKDQGIRLKVIDLPTTMMDLPEGQSWVFEMVNNILMNENHKLLQARPYKGGATINPLVPFAKVRPLAKIVVNRTG